MISTEDLIIKEYQKSGNNIRSLARKYKIRRRKIKNILKHANIKLKNCKEARREQIKCGLTVGKNHPNYGKTPAVGAGRCRWYYYNGHIYQGTWEFKLGLWFEQQDKIFNCHKDVRQFEYQINNKDKTYCPDFYLVNEDIFVEVKGYFTKDDRKKIEIVREQYPDVIIEIYDKNRLLELDIFDIDKTLSIVLDEYEINYKENKSLMSFIEKHEDDKIEIIKDYLVRKLNLTKIANKYETTYRVINLIYKKWIEKYWKDKDEREKFVRLYCINEINDKYRKNCDLHKLTKRYRISRKLLNDIVTKDAINERKELQQKKYDENYGKHLATFDLPEITSEFVNKILKDYNDNKSMRQIGKIYGLRKRNIRKILNDNDIEIRNPGYYRLQTITM